MRPDLSPKETSQVARVFGRDVSIGDQQIVPAVVVEIYEDRAPGPASHLYRGARADFFESLPGNTPKEAVSFRESPVGRASLVGGARQEPLLRRDPTAGRGEHVTHIQVHPAVVVDVGPADRHTRATIDDPQLRTWSLIYPDYTVAIPQPKLIKIPVTYVLPKGDLEFWMLVSDWLELKRRDGTIDELFEYWILGKTDAVSEPRWSVIRDVLHWVD